MRAFCDAGFVSRVRSRAALAAALASMVATGVASRAEAQVCFGDRAFEGCLDAIGGRSADGTGMRDPTRIIDDVFSTADTPPRFAPQLTFGRFVEERSVVNSTGCGAGRHNNPREYTAYSCETGAITPMRYHEVTDHLDWLFAQNYRVRGDGMGAADQDSCGGDTTACGFDSPWASAMVYDLQGAANRVVIFPVTDHVTDSCLEAFEYSVYLTDNPASHEIVAPGATPDPMKWNRALLVRAFMRGWTDDPDSTGTVEDMALHAPRQAMRRGTNTEAVADSITTVWALPCGVNFRYVGVVPGNYGNPDARCAFYSSEDEFDAVAGLNEDGTAICPDADGDGFRAASCGGNDCDDNDRTINPGAVEDCRATRDLNCDGSFGMCPEGTACVGGVCASGCLEGACADGFVCVRPDGFSREFCLPTVCRDVTCPPGEICGASGCQPPCEGALCPAGQRCLGGACVDACAGVTCPRNQHCDGGRCVPNCSCSGCPMGQRCNETSGRCEVPACAELSCPEELRDCTSSPPRCRASFCDGVRCPIGQTCDATMRRCVPDRCFGVQCPLGRTCVDGACVVAPTDAGPIADVLEPDVVLTLDAGNADAPLDASGIDGATLDVRGASETSVGTSPGCGCRVAGPSSESPRTRNRIAGLAAVFSLGVFLRARRRARRAR